MKGNLQEEFHTDKVHLLCYFLDLAIQQILYIRNVYPSCLFHLTFHPKFHLQVFTTKHAQLQQYIAQCVHSVKCWILKEGVLESRIVVSIEKYLLLKVGETGSANIQHQEHNADTGQNHQKKDQNALPESCMSSPLLTPKTTPLEEYIFDFKLNDKFPKDSLLTSTSQYRKSYSNLCFSFRQLLIHLRSSPSFLHTLSPNEKKRLYSSSSSSSLPTTTTTTTFLSHENFSKETLDEFTFNIQLHIKDAGKVLSMFKQTMEDQQVMDWIVINEQVAIHQNTDAVRSQEESPQKAQPGEHKNDPANSSPGGGEEARVKKTEETYSPLLYQMESNKEYQNPNAISVQMDDKSQHKDEHSQEKLMEPLQQVPIIHPVYSIVHKELGVRVQLVVRELCEL